MAYVKNIDPVRERILVDEGITVASGEIAEVSDDLADSLAEQELVWQRVNEDGSTHVAPNEPPTQIEAEPAKAEEAE